MRPSGYLTTRVGSLPAALIVCVLTAASIASAEQTPGGAGHAGQPLVLTGSGAGAGLARAASIVDGADIFSGAPFGAGFTGGVRVAVGDVNGDGIQDLIVGSGPGGGLVRVFSGFDLSMLMSFAPFGGGFNGGVYVASGDIDGDGRADVIVGAGSGGQVAAFSGVDAHELGRAFPFTAAYQGGVTVAAGDLDGDGHADVLAGTVNGGFVTVLSGADGHVIAGGFPFGPFFVGGVSIAVGDLNGDGRADIVVAPMSAGGLVLAFNGANLEVLTSFVPYPGIAGVTLAAADVDGDGRADIITGPGNGPPLVKIFSGADAHQMTSFLAFDAGLGGGAYVASNSQFVVPGPPTFTSGSTASWTVGSSNVFSITTSGSPTATIALSGALPAGLSFSGGTGSASISGTPTTPGSTTVTLTATNMLGTATQTLTLDVQPSASNPPPPGGGTPPVAPTFTTAGSTTFEIGTNALFLIQTTGSPAASLTVSGALPSGVTFTDTGNGVATLVGTAAVGTAGTYPLTITATNSAGAATQSFVLTVNNAPTPIFTSATATTFAVGAFGSFTVTTSASPTVVAITSTIPLPSGVTFVSNGDGTATLSGTPAAGSAGPYPLVFTASNGVATATQNFLLTVTAPSGGAPTITSANATTFVVGAPGTFTITTTGTAPVTITSTGTLPSGVTLTNNGDGTATLTGTPAAGSAGVYPLTVSASNSSGTATQSFTLTVNNPTTTPVFTSAPSTAFTVGVAGTFNITTAASPAVTSITLSSGTLPTGVTFTDNANGTAKLAGTPAAGSAGTYPLTFTATNGGAPVSQSFTLSVQRGASITSASSVTFTVGIAGSFTVTSAGSPTPALSSSALPAGLFFTDHGDGTATLGGTPQPGTGGPHTLTLTATNGVGAPGTQSFTLNVNEVGGFTSPNTATFTLNVAGPPFQV